MENNTNVTIETNEAINTVSNSEMTVWERIRMICHFLPLLTSAAWLLHSLLDPSNFVADYILFPLLVIGWISAIIARPVQLFTVAFGLIAGGWTLGWTLCPFFPMCIFTALLGAALGAGGALFLLAYAPAAVTIFCFIKDRFD